MLMPPDPLFEGTDDSFFNEIDHNDAAFEQLFKRYFTVLCAYCQFKYSFDLDLSKEAVHTAFIKLWEKRQSLSQSLTVKAYLYKIVNNTCLDIIKHRKIQSRYERYVLQHIHAFSPSNDFDPTEARSLKLAIDKAIEDLPDQMRKIFELSRYEGLKYAQIANLLNLSVKTVETQMSRALQKLRTKLIHSGIISCFIFLLI